MTTAAPSSDADLVQQCLANGSGAFSEIVTRYQTLICSLTYNATGSLTRSEDLAQEVFLTAWKELRQLREPEKLRPWLCGIARRLAANTVRRETRQPVAGAEPLDEEHHAGGPGPVEQTISREEEAILWRSLAEIPETYREPLILFYRENQSVEQVAGALELTEDTARQRLSRGRKLLQEQVALFVEGALRQSTPGRAFTLGVIAALPLLTTSATAATVGTAVAKTGATATSVGLLGMLSVVLGPIIGCFGAWLGIKASLDHASSKEERALIIRQAKSMIALIVGFLVIMGFAMPLVARNWNAHPVASGIVGGALPLLYAGALLTLILRFNRAQRKLRTEQTLREGPAVAAQRAQVWKTYEYISPWKFLGLPLVHIRNGRPAGEKLRPAVGWIAIGDVAIGLLVAVGGFSVGGISLGGCSLGLVAIGGAALGGLSFGGLAIGLWGAAGGMAIGYLAHGGCAVAWHAAEGGMAIARDFALGGSASAAQANDAVAREALSHIGFFRYAQSFTRQPILINLVWLPMLLVLWQAQRARKRQQMRGQRDT